MSRQYPRFLFSTTKSKKSEGPYIIHTLPPRAIMLVDEIRSEADPRRESEFVPSPYVPSLRFDISIIEFWDPEPDEDVKKNILEKANHWLRDKVERNELKFLNY